MQETQVQVLGWQDPIRKDRLPSPVSFLWRKQREQALSWNQDSILGWTVDFELYAQLSMEMTHQLEKQAPGRKSPRAHF